MLPRQFAFLLLIGSAALPAFSIPQSHRKETASPAWADLVTSMNSMHVAMASVEPSGDSDTDFVRLMLPHHQAAVDMAKAQLLYGKDPQMRRLAQEIITDQQSEMDLMRLWLERHAPPSAKSTQESGTEKGR
jgi:uncharacterized protein (DUF305 family)